MSKRSRRFGTRPGTRKLDVLKVAVIVDTSGSISDKELVIFFNEVSWMWKNGAKVTIFEADTEVHREYEYKGKFKGDVTGRGGTDLQDGLNHAEKGNYDVAVYFTDFYAPALPKKCKVPTLWVLSNPPQKEHWPCQWGRAVTIDTV